MRLRRWRLQAGGKSRSKASSICRVTPAKTVSGSFLSRLRQEYHPVRMAQDGADRVLLARDIDDAILTRSDDDSTTDAAEDSETHGRLAL